MIDLTIAVADGATVYVPIPCRCTLAKMVAVFQSSDVAANDTIKAYRDSTEVNAVTAVTEAGLVPEVGVPDSTHGQLIFDPESATAANQVIKLISGSETGSAAAIVTLSLDESAYVKQAASEA